MNALTHWGVELAKHFAMESFWKHSTAFAAGVTLTLIILQGFNRWKVHRAASHTAPVQTPADTSPTSAIDSEAMRSLGITACVRTLKGSKWEPDGCRDRTNRFLKVSGIMGAKWVDGEENIDKFRRCLRRIEGEHGAVQFLIVNPYGKAIEEIARLREDQHPHATMRYRDILERHIRLMEEFPCFEVKLFDYVPYFRVVIVDDRDMAVSRYKIWEGREAGWKAPHLILREDENPLEAEANSLFYAFKRHFDHVWSYLSVPAVDIMNTKGDSVLRR